MFRNRRRAASNPASKAPPSSSASLAATKAFIRDRESNGALSSAAAAAALRTLSPTPTPVGETVTKRMMRKGSVSSQGSASQRPQHLRRHSSSGSMTERSFRGPSPSRSSPSDHNAPPVPAVPKELPGVGAVHRRASSLEPPYRGGSPAVRGGGRGVSLDRGTGATSGRGQPRVSHLSKVTEDEQDTDPQSSVNFSRPMSQQQSPSPRTNTSARTSGWFGGPVVDPQASFRGAKSRPMTSDGPSPFETRNTQQAVQNAATRPVSTNRSQLAHGVEGARLASGSMRAKPSGSAIVSQQQQAAPAVPRTVDPKSPYAVYDPSTRSFIHKGDAIALHKAMSEEDIQSPPQYERQYDAPQQRRLEQRPAQPEHVDHWINSPPQYDNHELYEDAALAASTQSRFQSERDPEPPTSPQPSATVLERQHSEDFADADIRPSVDASTNRLLDSHGPERTETLEQDAHSPKFAANLDGPYPRLEPPARNVANSSPGPQSRDNARVERTHSLSPPRNAHFAPITTELNGVKHQPLPRSVSPGKSALKSSPSTSRRSYSPMTNDGRLLSRGAASEASDTISEEGTRKKKHVRVSFDEAPVIAGTSAYADTEIPPPLPNSLSASKWSTVGEDDDVDAYMKPRSVLPSFSSIRDQNRRSAEDEAPEKVTETVSSSLSASATSASEPLETSNDHAVGGILAQEFDAKNDRELVSQNPLPPEVTTVEGSGYASSDSDPSEVYNEAIPQASLEPLGTTDQTRSTFEPEPKTLTNPVDSEPDVPAIAVQPATPLPVESAEFPVTKSEPKVRRPFVPGGWEEESDSEMEESKTVPPQSAASASPGPSIRFEVPPHRDVDTDSTDNDSVYSDAYEDLSDSEGGFGSINAIVQTPISKPRSSLLASKHAPSSAEGHTPEPQGEVADVANTRPKAQSSESWDAAQQHWSEVNKARKHSQTQTPPDAPATSPVVSSKKEPPVRAAQSQGRHTRMGSIEEVPRTQKGSKPTQSTAQPRKSAMKKPSSPPQVSSTSQPHLRKSMRDGSIPGSAPASEPRLRKSMRDGPIAGSAPSDPHIRKTMRGPDSMGANRGPSSMAASRYSMPPAETKQPKGTLQKKHIPAAAAASSVSRQRPQSASAAVRSKPMTPAPTYDSDSDASASSFQRQRPRNAQKEGGRYTMRGSMRSGPDTTIRPAPTMRPISPPVAASPPPTMRRSMRPSSPNVESPANVGVRSSKFSIRSLSPGGRFRPRSSMDSAPPLPAPTQSPRTAMPTFGKKSKIPKAEASRSRHKSRFADSSDEEDDGPRRFQSRFVDSDDSDAYELPPGLAPVRGIPKRGGDEDGDSTDLEDEASDAEASPVGLKNIEKGQLAPANGVTNGQGTSLATGSLRNSKHAPAGSPAIEAGKKAKAKRGFFGLGKKKPAAYLADAEADTRNGASTDIPIPPEHRNRDLSRPLTPIGEDKDIEAGESASRSPKLHRRANTPQWGRSASDSWPLPPPPTVGEERRPMSADGPARRTASLRPTLKKRQSSQISEVRTAIDPKSGKEVVVGRSGKKKKFQGLRRVFGLDD